MSRPVDGGSLCLFWADVVAPRTLVLKHLFCSGAAGANDSLLHRVHQHVRDALSPLCFGGLVGVVW